MSAPTHSTFSPSAAKPISPDATVTVVGGGLAGSECAWQLAERGHNVVLIEMRRREPANDKDLTLQNDRQTFDNQGLNDNHASPGLTSFVDLTPAHKTDRLAELVCSNSFGSQTDYSAPGQLKWEADKLGSLILKAAREASIPAGMALGVDREIFAASITQALANHPRIKIERRVIHSLDEIPRPAVIATGPLTDMSLAESIRDHLSYGEMSSNFLFFFDAIAPIVDVDTINMDIAWMGNRYNKVADADGNVAISGSDCKTADISGSKTAEPEGSTDVTETLDVDTANKGAEDSGSSVTASGDYINCPMTKDEYFKFIDAMKAARKIEPKDFEKDTPYFEGCMPIEAMLERGPMTPLFGPMSPKGLIDPRTGRRPYAVVQLRQENKEATSYNMVGFQTKMAYGDQKEVFRLIPGLENAEFLKLGGIHRNMYIHSPQRLTPILSSKRDPWLFFAGQISGVEGYFDSTCMGLLVARFLSEQLHGVAPNRPPRATAFGSLLNAITEYKEIFQPTNINFGLFPLPEMPEKRQQDRRLKREIQLANAKAAFPDWLKEAPSASSNQT